MNYKIVFLFFSALFVFFPAVASAQTPTLVQHVSCPNSSAPAGNGNGQSSTPDYLCPLPEPSQSGNAILVGITSYNGGAPYSVSDDKGNAYNLVDSGVDGNTSFFAIYLATNVVSGTRFVDLHGSNSEASNAAMVVSEYYNVAPSSAVDAHSCKAASTSATIAAGTITPTVTGDLLWQWAANASGGGSTPGSVSSFTIGSQSSITWQFDGTDIYDGDAVQAGVYNSTAAINPTFTSGTAQAFDSCVVALKAASAGTAPSNAFRIVHMLHQQMPQNAANPWPVQFAASGNLIVVSYISGGNIITSASSTPSNTWSSTGIAAGGTSITAASQIYYSGNASTSNAMTISFTRDSTGTDATYMIYDFTGAAAAPFDKDSSGQTGNQTNLVNTLTTCSGCVTPSNANEVIIGNAGWNWCTGNTINAPGGALFDAATYTGTDVNGPQSVDQNNGWFHYYAPNTNAITATWGLTCGGNPEGEWAGRVAAFKSGGTVSQQPAPPTQLKAVAN